MIECAKVLVVTLAAVLVIPSDAAASSATSPADLAIGGLGLVPIHRWQEYHCHRRRGYRRWCHQGAGRRSDDRDAEGAERDTTRRAGRRRQSPRGAGRWRNERALPERYPPAGWPPSDGGRAI